MLFGDNGFLQIHVPFECQQSHTCQSISEILHRILPPRLFMKASQDVDLRDDVCKEFQALLPLVVSSQSAPTTFSIYCVSKSRPNGFKFFLEMISNWLLPGKKINILYFHANDFQISSFGDEVLSLCEAQVSVPSEADLKELRRNLSLIEAEMRLGMKSSLYAQRILEIKGLSNDAKTGFIQENMARLIARFPNIFDYDLLTEMQHVLVMCRDEFKQGRSSQHLSRIISAEYFFRKKLREEVKENAGRRHLHLKLFRASLQKQKSVLGLVVGVNFLENNEVFEERHLLSAIQNYVPNAQAVPASFFANRRASESICTLYLEIEKPNDAKFTDEEIRLLRKELSFDLKDRIEHLMHPLFMPRNDEEIMRNILTLSNQIKYIHDMPQMIISFDKQTHADLYFTIIFVKVMKPEDLPVMETLHRNQPVFGYIHERSKTVGSLRKKYSKEATVFQVRMPKDHFLRRDHSIDLNKARQSVVNELFRIFGEIRDFNGGMISKQNELLCALRALLDNAHVKYNDLLLENFFYSLSPDMMRTVLEPKDLQALFTLLLASINEGLFSGNQDSLKIVRDESRVFVMMKSEERTLRETISRSLEQLNIPRSKLGSIFVVVYEISYTGYLYLCDDKQQQDAFCEIIQGALAVR